LRRPKKPGFLPEEFTLTKVIFKRAAVFIFLFIVIAVCGGCSKSPVVQGYAFVTNADGVTQLRINADGSLTPIKSPPISAEGGSGTITVDPSGKVAYFANSSGDFGFTIDALGNLTLISTLTVSAGGSGSIIVHPSGKYAYAANFDSVSQYTINTDGGLTPMSIPTVSAGVGPSSITVDPSGKYAYVVNSGGKDPQSSISQYWISAEGNLTPMSVPTVTGVGEPISIAIDPSGRYGYITNLHDISQFTIGPNGSLVRMGIPIVAAAGGPEVIAIEPTGKYVYVGSAGGVVSQFTISVDGSLASMSTPTVQGSVGSLAITVDPSGKYVYIVNTFGVSQYTIGADGGLTPMDPPIVAAGEDPGSIAVVRRQ
jgi:DNA-binding beta-propeller fold protein YncE